MMDCPGWSVKTPHYTRSGARNAILAGAAARQRQRTRRESMYL
jgi:hypothetical protein